MCFPFRRHGSAFNKCTMAPCHSSSHILVAFGRFFLCFPFPSHSSLWILFLDLKASCPHPEVHIHTLDNWPGTACTLKSRTDKEQGLPKQVSAYTQWFHTNIENSDFCETHFLHDYKVVVVVSLYQDHTHMLLCSVTHTNFVVGKVSLGFAERGGLREVRMT